MKMIINHLEDLRKTGIYKIQNIINNKVYIGSTGKSFKSRFIQHKSELTNNKHGNPHLQSSYNKYGPDAFVFEIVEICEECIINREKFFIDEFQACNKERGFNINENPDKPCSFNLEVRTKISNTLKEKYKKGEIVNKNKNFTKGFTPWNKGMQYEKEQFNMHTKKTITPLLEQAWKNTSKRSRENNHRVRVLDINKNILLEANSTVELYEWSLTEKNDLPIISNHSKSKILTQDKISRHIKNGKLYKGLYFEAVKKVQNK